MTGALASTASYGIQALCVLAAGQIPMSGESRSRSLLPGLASPVNVATVRAGIYIFGMLILQTFPAAMSNLMRAMVVKQGIKVNSDVGRGQLNA